MEYSAFLAQELTRKAEGFGGFVLSHFKNCILISTKTPC